MEKIKGVFSKTISFFVLFSFTMILGILVFVDRRNLDWFNYRIMFRNYVFVLGWFLVLISATRISQRITATVHTKARFASKCGS